MRKNLLLFFILSFFMNNVFSKERSESDMQSIANNTLLATCTRGNSQYKLDKLYEGNYYNVYGKSGSGFAVISRDDIFQSVLAYSTESSFSENNLPCGLKWWMKTIEPIMNYYLNDGIPCESSEIMLNGMQKTVATSVAPFITTKWGQGWPYNEMCPKSGTTHMPTGCIATAMAQCMNFYKYPSKGNSFGTATYTINNQTRTVSANFANSTYNWSLLKDTYDSTATTDEVSAISKIMYHCGVGAQMAYAESSSGANELNAGLALNQYFLYDSCSLHCYQRSLYNDVEWTEMLYSELSKGYPVLYCGRDSLEGGHAFVFDGYDKSGLVHVNWGWDGACDGYYDFNLLAPISSSYKFALDQSMIVGIRSTSDGNKYFSQWMADTVFKANRLSANILTYQINNVYNVGITNFYGLVGAVLQKGDMYIQLVCDTLASCPPYSGPSASGTITYNKMKNLAVGTYKLYLASKALTEKTWQPIRSKNGVVNAYNLVKTSDNYSLTSDENNTWMKIDGVIDNDYNNEIIRVYNISGQLLHTILSKDFNIDAIDGKGFIIIKRGNSSMKKFLR